MPSPIGTRAKLWLARDEPAPQDPKTWRDAFLGVYATIGAAAGVVVGITAHRWDDGLWTFLLAITALRTYSLYRAVAWIWKRGYTFRQKWENLGDDARREIVTETDAGKNRLFRIYRDTGGLFIPFGVRGMVADRWWRGQSGPFRFVAHQLYRLWKFYIFAPAWMIGVWFAVYYDPHPSQTTKVLGTIAVLLVMFGGISVGLEAALSYLILGGWSLRYHALNVQISQKVTELAAFAGGAVALLAGTSAAVSFVAREDAGFAETPPESGIASQAGRSLYYAITMLTGNGDATPTGTSGHFVTATAYAGSLLFLVVVISLLFDAISNTP